MNNLLNQQPTTTAREDTDLTLYGLRLLLVDDDPTQLRWITEGLRALGMEVLTASDGEQAVDCVARFGSSLDLVFMDFMMPRMNGLEAFQAIHRSCPDLPVVLTSGSLELKIDALLRDGVAGFLQKPYGLWTIGHTIQRHARRGGTAAPGEPSHPPALDSPPLSA